MCFSHFITFYFVLLEYFIIYFYTSFTCNTKSGWVHRIFVCIELIGRLRCVQRYANLKYVYLVTFISLLGYDLCTLHLPYFIIYLCNKCFIVNLVVYSDLIHKFCIVLIIVKLDVFVQMSTSSRWPNFYIIWRCHAIYNNIDDLEIKVKRACSARNVLTK